MGRWVSVTRQQDRGKNRDVRSSTCIFLSIYQTCDPSQGARTNSGPALPSGPYCPAHPRNAVPKVLVLQEALSPRKSVGLSGERAAPGVGAERRAGGDTTERANPDP